MRVRCPRCGQGSRGGCGGRLRLRGGCGCPVVGPICIPGCRVLSRRVHCLRGDVGQAAQDVSGGLTALRLLLFRGGGKGRGRGRGECLAVLVYPLILYPQGAEVFGVNAGILVLAPGFSQFFGIWVLQLKRKALGVTDRWSCCEPLGRLLGGLAAGMAIWCRVRAILVNFLSVTQR